MSGQFTPGPWEVEPEDHMSMGPCVTADGGRDDGWIICDLSNPTSLCGTPTEDLPEKIITERAANARLIAAAPELLEALSKLVDALDSCVALTPDLIASAEAAIAQATQSKDTPQ